MNKLGKDFWRKLCISAIIIGVAYGLTIYFALQERHHKDEIRRQKVEKQRLFEEKSQWRDSIKHHHESVENTVNGRKKWNISLGKNEDEDEDIDPYEDPDFDDLFPGEEYDEEFVDRSKGDPELYPELYIDEI